MRLLLYITGILSLLALATLSYSQNYTTREVLSDIEGLKVSIRARQQQLRALQDEWAYLNRPDRIKALTVLNYTHIQLIRQLPEPPHQINDLPFNPDPEDFNPSEEVLE